MNDSSEHFKNSEKPGFQGKTQEEFNEWFEKEIKDSWDFKEKTTMEDLKDWLKGSRDPGLVSVSDQQFNIYIERVDLRNSSKIIKMEFDYDEDGDSFLESRDKSISYYESAAVSRFSSFGGFEILENLEIIDIPTSDIDFIAPLIPLSKLHTLKLNYIPFEREYIKPLLDIDSLFKFQGLKNLAICVDDIEDIKKLARLTNLDFLHLHLIDIFDISNIDLSGIKEIAISTSNYESDKSYNFGKINLVGFDGWMGANKSFIENLEHYKGLKSFKVRGYPLENLQVFSNFAELEELDLRGCGLQSFNSSFISPTLKSLVLRHEEQLLQDEIILENFASMKLIELKGCPCPKELVLKDIEEIQRIDICFLEEDTYKLSIDNCKNISSIRLYKCDLGDLSCFTETAKSIEALSLHRCKLENVFHLLTFTNLECLQIEGHQIKDLSLTKILESQLRYCNIS